MSLFGAGALVFFTSGAVLVLEILAGRLLAPYVGVTLETYTAIIGTVLAGIASGTWAGGFLADRVEPRRVLGPLLVAGGALSMATVPLVRILGASVRGGGPGAVVLLALSAFFLPAAVLSAVAPAVVKLQLRDLAETGTVVGRLSALGTVGAIVGTFLAGFVLAQATPTTVSIFAVGGALLVVGGLLWARLSAMGGRAVVAVATVALTGFGLGPVAGSPCDVETVYHCARVVADPARPGGRTLMLDTLRHSYVDLDDPSYLGFRYARVFADVIAAAAPPGALDVLHVGGGGFTMPRYLRAVRPGTNSVVFEIDPGVARLSERALGLRPGPDLVVRIGDARTLLAAIPPTSRDLVLGDAFGGLAVPWHLTTVEFVTALRSSLRAGGIYVLNIIDYPPMRFVRAEVATLARVFANVAVIAPADVAAGSQGGNFVLVAGDGPIDAGAITARMAARGGQETVLVGPAATVFAGVTPLLTDDYAPADQWLARSRRR